MTFKVGDKVRRKPEWIGVDYWEWGSTVCTINMVDRAGDLHFDNGAGGFWFKDRFELVEEDQPVTPPKASLTAWTDAEIGPFDVRVGSRTDLSTVDTLNRLWFDDPVGQKLNQIAIEYKESPDMTDDELVQKIMTELESMGQVTRVLISWKSRPNGIVWDRE